MPYLYAKALGYIGMHLNKVVLMNFAQWKHLIPLFRYKHYFQISKFPLTFGLQCGQGISLLGKEGRLGLSALSSVSPSSPALLLLLSVLAPARKYHSSPFLSYGSC